MVLANAFFRFFHQAGFQVPFQEGCRPNLDTCIFISITPDGSATGLRCGRFVFMTLALQLVAQPCSVWGAKIVADSCGYCSGNGQNCPVC
jgi:hypothetical protein